MGRRVMINNESERAQFELMRQGEKTDHSLSEFKANGTKSTLDDLF